MTEALALEWRPMREDDRNYVLSSWLCSCAEGEFRSVRRGVFFALYQPMVKAMLARSTVAIASTPDMPDVVLGWMAIEGDDVLHYLLVKPRWRRLGIADWMTRDLRLSPAVYTHEPSHAASRLVGERWEYDPMRRFEKAA